MFWVLEVKRKVRPFWQKDQVRLVAVSSLVADILGIYKQMESYP